MLFFNIIRQRCNQIPLSFPSSSNRFYHKWIGAFLLQLFFMLLFVVYRYIISNAAHDMCDRWYLVNTILKLVFLLKILSLNFCCKKESCWLFFTLVHLQIYRLVSTVRVAMFFCFFHFLIKKFLDIFVQNNSLVKPPYK